MGCPWDVSYIWDILLSQHLQLRLVQPRSPHPEEFIQLRDSLGHLCLGVGQVQNLFCESQELNEVENFSDLLVSYLCLLYLYVEENWV